MELQVGTEFNLTINGNNKNHRKVVLKDGRYLTVDENGKDVFLRYFHTLEELNDFYSYKDWTIEIIQPEPKEQELKSESKETSITTDEIGRVIAYELMKKGKSLSVEMLGIIEDAVFDLLIEKGIIVEKGDVE